MTTLADYAPAIALLVQLRNIGAIRTAADELYEVVDAITGLRPNPELLERLQGPTQSFMKTLEPERTETK